MTGHEIKVLEKSIENLKDISINQQKMGIPTGGIDEVRKDLELIYQNSNLD